MVSTFLKIYKLHKTSSEKEEEEEEEEEDNNKSSKKYLHDVVQGQRHTLHGISYPLLLNNLQGSTGTCLFRCQF